ncbi:MAG: hypothetical protein V7L12_10015 [Nostoc sp.]
MKQDKCEKSGLLMRFHSLFAAILQWHFDRVVWRSRNIKEGDNNV